MTDTTQAASTAATPPAGDGMEAIAGLFKREIAASNEEPAAAPVERSAPVEAESDDDTPVYEAQEEAPEAEAEDQGEAEPAYIPPPPNMTPDARKVWDALSPEAKQQVWTQIASANAQPKQAPPPKPAPTADEAQHRKNLQMWSDFGERLRPPSEELAEQDPAAYVRQLAQFNKAAMQVQQARSELARIQQAEMESAEAQRHEYLAQEAQKLAALIPDIAKEGKGEKIRSDIVRFARASGISDAQLSNASASEINLLYKAMLHEKAVAGAARAAQVAKPAAPKAARPGNIQANLTAKAKSAEAIQQRLEKTGSHRDFAELLKLGL